MPKKKEKKPTSVKRLFSAIGGGVVKTGGAAQRLGRIRRGPRVREKGGEVAQRLRELKRLEILRREELKEERRLKEEEAWEKRVELKRPLSERLSSVFYSPLKRPARSMANFFRGWMRISIRRTLGFPLSNMQRS